MGFRRSGILWYMGLGWSLSSKSSEGSVVRVTAVDSLQVREVGLTMAFDLDPSRQLEIHRVYNTELAEDSWA